MSDETIRIDQERIVHETVDEEVIIIDLETGAYFSLTRSGVVLWPAIARGTTRTELAAIMGAAYGMQPGEIETHVTAFVEALMVERIVTVEPDGAQRSATVEPDRPGAVEAARPFEPPLLSKFTQMSDLLLLDPIQDVDAQGWPRKTRD